MSKLNQYIEATKPYSSAAAAKMRDKILGDEKEVLRAPFKSRNHLDFATQRCLQRMIDRQVAGRFGMMDPTFYVPKIATPNISIVRKFVMEIHNLIKKKQRTSFDNFLIKRFTDNIGLLLTITRARYNAVNDLLTEYDLAIHKHNFWGPRTTVGNNLVDTVQTAWDTYHIVRNMRDRLINE